MILVSACLAGLNTRYDGDGASDERIKKLVERQEAIPVCPEQLGGCPTPRPPAEINGGTGQDVLSGRCRVIDRSGGDVTEQFINGARQTLKLAALTGCTKAILKSKSPSCGCKRIYDGSFSGKLIKGNGVTAELLIQNGIEVLTEDEI